MSGSTIARMRRAGSILVFLAAATLVLGACSPTPSTAPTSASPPGLPTTSEPTSGPGATLPAQTDTAWGRIWDALPKWFPVPDGASPTETGEGPFTAELALPAGSTPKAAADFFRDELMVLLGTLNVDGPLEDGSYVLSMPGRCQAEVRIVPLGDLVVARILYGAGCPFLMR